jgi:hypothetical protein
MTHWDRNRERWVMSYPTYQRVKDLPEPWRNAFAGVISLMAKRKSTSVMVYPTYRYVEGLPQLWPDGFDGPMMILTDDRGKWVIARSRYNFVVDLFQPRPQAFEFLESVNGHGKGYQFWSWKSVPPEGIPQG